MLRGSFCSGHQALQEKRESLLGWHPEDNQSQLGAVGGQVDRLAESQNTGLGQLSPARGK
jgi:hypothetical protein